MQFPHIWTEIGKSQKLLGRLLAQADLGSCGVKTAARASGRAEGLLPPPANLGWAGNGSRKESPQEDTTPSGSRKKPFQTQRRTELPPEKGKTAVQGREGRRHRFLIAHALPPTGFIPVRLLLSREVIQPHCQLLGARRMASMGK